jgi:hypothetical protein
LQDAAYEFFPELTAPDAHNAIEAIAALLPTYGGPLDSDSFERWGKRKAIEESSRFVFMHLANGEYKRMILATIAKEMWTSAEDCSVGAEDLYSEVLMLIFDMAPNFLRNKRAKLSTRLCSLARNHVYMYHNKKNKTRLAAVTKQMADDSPKGGLHGVEMMRAEEIALIKADAIADGYRELGIAFA